MLGNKVKEVSQTHKKCKQSSKKTCLEIILTSFNTDIWYKTSQLLFYSDGLNITWLDSHTHAICMREEGGGQIVFIHKLTF